MTLPFTTNEFLQVFRDYNTTTWPAPLILPFVGLASAWLLLSAREWARRTALGLVGVLWAWMAIAYHLAFFARINPAARGFALLALLQGAAFVFAASTSPAPRSMRLDVHRAFGGALIAFSLILYPALSYLADHRYPAVPTFGLPCPTTIFTFGVLATLHDELSWRYSVIPLLWAGVGTMASFELGMTEDLSLGVSGLLFLGLMVARGLAAARSGKPVRRFVR